MSFHLVEWLAKSLGACQNDNSKEFYSVVREGNLCFLAQRCSNMCDRYLMIVEYKGGAWRSFIFILKGEEGDRW